MRILIAFLLLSTPCIAADYRFEILLAIAKQKAKPAATISVTPTKRSAKSHEIAYFQTVRRGYARPPRWDIQGDDYATKEKAIAHLYRDHLASLPQTHEGRPLDLSPRSYDEILTIHDLIHQGRRVGEWLPTVCPIDGGPCQMTFEWHLP